MTANWGGGGPGGIASDLYEVASKAGWTCRFAYGRGAIPKNVNQYKIGDIYDPYLHVVSARIFDNAGFVGKKATRALVEDIKHFNPDVINLHNLLRYTINVEVLFDYLRETSIPVVWTLHDCWGVTGHCITGICKNLEKGCGHCPNKKEYPECYFFDHSRQNLKRKIRCFSGIKKMTLISPSNWLANLTRNTYLQQYPIKVIPNGIDLTVFKPYPSNIREQYGLTGKKVILAVAGEWTKNKGAKYIYNISEQLDDTYAFVMIGKNSDTELKQRRIIHVDHTTDRAQLAQWYTTADVFINPTLGDNFPTVNLEALACGTPVITFDTGGSGESIGECGMIIKPKDTNAFVSAILQYTSKEKNTIMCVERAQMYDKNRRYLEYIELFKSLIDEK